MAGHMLRESDRKLMAKVCHAYYRQQRTQAQIGQQLGLSRQKVGRLLKEALHSGLVRIHIASGFQHTAELEERIERRFGLKTAIVVSPGGELSDGELKQVVAQEAAEYLRELIRDGDAVGVGWGSTTFELVNQFRPLALPGCHVVQVTGGNKRVSPQFGCHEVTRLLAEKLGVEPVLLHAPGIVDHPRTREVLLQESSIAETFAWFGRLRIAVVGIGSLVPAPSSMLLASGYVDDAELEALHGAGAVGDVFSYFIDDGGQPVQAAFNERLITMGRADVRRIPFAIGVATGAVKARTVAAAVRGGYVNVLIIDEALATALLQ